MKSLSGNTSQKIIFSHDNRFSERIFHKESFCNKHELALYINELMYKKGFEKASCVYNRVNITKQTWSNIYSEKNCPTPENARLLVIGLECTLAEAEKLLSLCGMCFIPGNFTDEAIKYCIDHKKYNLEAIEERLEKVA